ncbi:hypothetical protein [Novosphingopyxis baekryungensis]|uniref:hypothetical protein n=1 Tax=Novosphingopyxis baekryungensis TaxID=279369 RepID=UPI0012ECA191|nr:hypothetical protein [Novosphingopyxis baekryungensis]
MRIERTGPVEPLTPRVERFIFEALRGQSLDDPDSSEQLRPDYACFRGLVAIELKTLEDDGEERVENLVEQLRKRPDWPIFLGSAPMDSFIKNTDDPDGIGKQVLERIGRGITRPLQKANRQLEAHEKDHPRKSLVKILILVNEDHEAYDPHTVSYILWHAVRRRDKDGSPRFAHVDAIIYFTERHATIVENLLTFPLTVVEGSGIQYAPWKSEVVEFIQHAWIRHCDYPDLSFDEPQASDFTTIDHIPEHAPRHERWRTDYRRNPYLQPLTNDQLRDRFDEIMLVNTLSFLKNPPVTISKDQTTLGIEQFTHLMLEMANRAIPMTAFSYDPRRDIAAARRLGLPESVETWILKMDAEKRQQI